MGRPIICPGTPVTATNSNVGPCIWALKGLPEHPGGANSDAENVNSSPPQLRLDEWRVSEGGAHLEEAIALFSACIIYELKPLQGPAESVSMIRN